MATHSPGLLRAFPLRGGKLIVFSLLRKCHLYSRMEMAKCRITAVNLSCRIIPGSAPGAVHRPVTLGCPQAMEGRNLPCQKIKPLSRSKINFPGQKWQWGCWEPQGKRHQEEFQGYCICTAPVRGCRRAQTAAQRELPFNPPTPPAPRGSSSQPKEEQLTLSTAHGIRWMFVL